MIDTDLYIIDGATPWLDYMAVTKPDWVRKALKSFGWYAQQRIKAGIRSGAPGGQTYAPFMPPDMRAKLEESFGNNVPRKFWPLGKLANAVGYQYEEGNNLVRVGWLSESAIKLGEKIEQGSSKTITEQMRRYFWAAGIPLSNKPQILVPARQTYGPMAAMLAPKAAHCMEDKIIEYMTTGAPPSRAKSKKYRVRG